MLSLGALLAVPAFAGPLSEAFDQATAFGRAGNAAARSQFTGDAARASVPHFMATPAEAAYFGSPGLTTSASTKVGACAGASRQPGGFSDQSCNAIDFSKVNPTRRPNFTIAPTDSLLTRAKTITADPQAIAGNLAGTYSACTVQTVTRPDVFETQICHQARTIENTSCDKILIVTPVLTPGCTAGQFLTRVTADPCPTCLDLLVYEFTCGANDYLMHVFTIAKATGAVFSDLGSQHVPGTLGTEIARTPGPSRRDASACYQTWYSQSCSGANCTIGAWSANPCQGTTYSGVSTFAMPTTVRFEDTWDNQCAALEARAQ